MKATLKRRMIIFFSLTFSALLVVFGVLILTYNIRSFQNQSYEYCKKIVGSNILLIDRYFEQLQTISNVVARDQDIVKAVAYRNQAENVDYAIELYNQRRVGNKINQLDLLSTVSNALIIGERYQYLYYYGDSPVLGYSFENCDWFLSADHTEDYSVRFTNFHTTDYLLTQRSNRTVSMITPIWNPAQYSAVPKAYLLCDFDLAPALSGNAQESEVQSAIYDGVNPVYFPGESTLSDEQAAVLTENLRQKNRSFLIQKSARGDRSYLVVNETSHISGWSILGIKPLDEIETMRATITYFMIALIIISCGIIVVLSMMISKTVLVPINQLVQKFNQISAGNFYVKFESTGSAELDVLSSTAGHMVESISQLTEDVVKEQRKLAKEQLKVLQHQINPHFLNNVLQSIKALAVCGDVAAVSKATTLLGKILSYSVYNPYNTVELQDELRHVENYIEIQNIRYDGLIAYRIDYDDDLIKRQVPKLIIQPVVENAIEHGFESRIPGMIRISVSDERDGIDILVADNGAGMDTCQLAELNRHLTDNATPDDNKSIGLLNVNQRIKNAYGLNYGIQVRSQAGVGTTVVISIPHEKEEKPC